MSKNNVSASGERAAIGGYLPQFDEFAAFVYMNLVNKQLEWIKVADPRAEKLNDIQPNLASSWKEIKATNPNKIVIPHLITNKTISQHDSKQKID